jgi:hypothetical protein
MTRRLCLLGGLYAVAAIITFGHAATNGERERLARCAANRHSFACYSKEEPVLGGILAGLMWPLYLSWEAWS